MNATDLVVKGAARFTVISPICVRMEYAPRFGFVDAPTLFVIDRRARCADARIMEEGGSLVVDTGNIRVEYLKGRHAWTRLGYSRSAAGICIRIEPSEGRFDGQPKERGYRVELPCTHEARSAMFEGAPIPFDFDPATSTNIITIPPRGIDKTVELLVDTTEIDPLIMKTKLRTESRRLTGERVGDELSS